MTRKLTSFILLFIGVLALGLGNSHLGFPCFDEKSLNISVEKDTEQDDFGNNDDEKEKKSEDNSEKNIEDDVFDEVYALQRVNFAQLILLHGLTSEKVILQTIEQYIYTYSTDLESPPPEI
ncbi:MAG: hypothetical protein JNL70_23750 [Saprospiraceae bacterium]|nr:hypothetical protein [Saprospiraceae bacterium]